VPGTCVLYLVPLLMSACWNPHIQPGAFRCSPIGTPCPDGFFCDRALDLCVNAAYEATLLHKDGGAPATDARPDSLRDASPEVPDLPPVSCTPAGGGPGLCDPACNTGCARGEKCSVNQAGSLTCNPPAPRAANESSETCLVTTPVGDLSRQTDDCPAGQLCTSLTACGSICRQFCRQNSDCASGNCGRDVGGDQKVCDVPLADCDPVPGATACGSTAAQGCYLSATTLQRVCDCPNSKGVGNGPCTDSRDCFPGQVCYNPTSMAGQARCYRVCRLAGPDGGSTSPADAGEIPCPGGP